jgi:hypothetical protein
VNTRFLKPLLLQMRNVYRYTTARPSSQIQMFDTPGSFFRIQKEDQSLSEAAAKVNANQHDGHPPV